ncbi:MAG: hypothetical protein LBC74_12555 [Planctomycetaceae bacterium]|jgi:hypothetical protein|nr:hypothetical protein [Planctomycetaceae bacterium]
MLKKFIKWIDAFGDSINPIVVRDVRRCSSNKSHDILIIVYSCLLVVFCFMIYFLCDWETIIANFAEINKQTIRNCGFINFSSIILFDAICFGMFPSLICVCHLIFLDKMDDIFQTIPLTPRQYLHAYMFEFFILSLFFSSFLASLVLIFFAESLNFLVSIVILILGILLGQIIFLTILSFVACMNHTNQLLYMLIFFVIGGNVVFLPIVVPWLVLIFLWEFFNWSQLDINHGFGFVSFFILLPISLLLLGATAYQLSFLTLKTRRQSLVSVILFNIFCYTLFSFFAALIYFAIA